MIHFAIETGAAVIRLRERFDLRRHVRGARDPVCRIAAFENPDGAVWLGALLVPRCAKRLVTGETLHTNLSRQHGLRRFGRSLLRPRRKLSDRSQYGSAHASKFVMMRVKRSRKALCLAPTDLQSKGVSTS